MTQSVTKPLSRPERRVVVSSKVRPRVRRELDRLAKRKELTVSELVETFIHDSLERIREAR